jgi:hypothetical protein
VPENVSCDTVAAQWFTAAAPRLFQPAFQKLSNSLKSILFAQPETDGSQSTARGGKTSGARFLPESCALVCAF